MSRRKKHIVSPQRSSLGRVLVDLGHIDQELLENLSKNPCSGCPRLGERLVREGHIDARQLKEALETQKVLRSDRPVDALVDLINRKTEKLLRHAVEALS